MQLKARNEEKLLIGEFKEKLVLSKDEIRNYLKYSLKETPQQDIDKYIKQVFVYPKMIEILSNCAISNEQTFKNCNYRNKSD